MAHHCDYPPAQPGSAGGHHNDVTSRMVARDPAVPIGQRWIQYIVNFQTVLTKPPGKLRQTEKRGGGGGKLIFNFGLNGISQMRHTYTI